MNCVVKLVSPKKDITDQTFGFLKAIQQTMDKENGSYIWEFECLLCGKHVNYRIGRVTSGEVVSCGCYKNQNLTKKSNQEKLGLIDGTC